MKKYHRPEFSQRTNKNILLRNRRDREGSNWINKAANFVRAKSAGFNIYYDKVSFGESPWTSPFCNFATPIKQEDFGKILGKNMNDPSDSSRCGDGGWAFKHGWETATYQGQADVVKEIELDLVSGFRAHYKEDFFNCVKQNLNNAQIEPLWTPLKKIACVHLRTEDVRRQKFLENRGDYDHRRMLDFFNKNLPIKGKRFMPQVSYNMNQINKLISNLSKLYPDHEIHFITAPGYEKHHDLQGKYKIHTPDKSLAIYNMVNADILVLSHSYFSAMAGFLHQGSKVHYPRWGPYTAMGLDTKFDQTQNWQIMDLGV